MDIDADGRAWGITISKSWRLNDLWICHCFPYYLEGHPPYPGFECLKIWLNLYCPSAAYEAIYNNGSPQLQVTFSNPEEAMLFRLNV